MDEASARAVLATAAATPAHAHAYQRLRGIDAGAAPLLSFGDNAVFAVGDLVAKIARTPELLDRARHEVAVARWLEEQGVPAARAAGEPELVDGHPLTLWHRLPDPVRPAEARDLAELLRMVHA
ncbi:phosphotransferase, partial [Streptomyces sp. CO7]